MQDRTNLNPQLLERMRKELIELLSKYVEMDKEALELNFEQEGEQMALMLSIPVLKAKSEEEIEKALTEEETEVEDDEVSKEENVEEDVLDEEAGDSCISEDETEPDNENKKEDDE